MNTSLEQRVAKLEKSLHLYRLSFIGIIAVASALLTMSFKNTKSTVPDLVQAKTFQVVNDAGKVLVEINKEDGNGQLSTFNSSGQKLVSLFTTNDGAGGLNTFDKDGTVLFKVTNTSSGGGYMALFNGQAKEIAELGVTTNESGYIRLNDRYANKQIWMTYTTDGGGYLSLLKDNLEMIRLSTPAAGGRVGIYNNSNTRIVYLGAQENKDGNITLWNSTGTRTGGLPQ